MDTSPEDLVRNIKTKYPEYKDIPDDLLLQKVAAKYTEYMPIANKAFGSITPGKPTPIQDFLKGTAETAKTVIGKAATADGGNYPVMGGLDVVRGSMLGPGGEALVAPTGLKEREQNLVLSAPSNAARAVAAGNNPLEGVLQPEQKAPSFATTVVNHLISKGITDEKTHVIVGTEVGTLLDLGVNYLAFGFLPKVPGEVASAYTGIQGKAREGLGKALSETFVKAGVPEQEAAQAVNTIIAKKWATSSPMARTPWRIHQTTKALEGSQEALSLMLQDEIATRSSSAQPSQSPSAAAGRQPFLPSFSLKDRLSPPDVAVSPTAERPAVPSGLDESLGISKVEKPLTSEERLALIKDRATNPSMRVKLLKIQMRQEGLRKQYDVLARQEQLADLKTVLYERAIQVAGLEATPEPMESSPEPKTSNESGFIRTIDVGPLKKYFEDLSPVRSAPRDVNRAITQRDIDFNVTSFNVGQLKDFIVKLVPDASSRELITHFIESGGVDGKDQMTPEMVRAATIIRSGQEKIGKMALERGIIKNYLDNYMRHLTIDSKLSPEEISAKIQWAVSTNKISRFVEAKFPRVRTPEGEVVYPTVKALEAAGIPVVTKDAAELFGYTMRSQGIAIINSDLYSNLKKVPYVDPANPKDTLFQVMRFKEGDRIPSGYRLLRRGPFTMAWASPEAYGPLSSIAEPVLGGRIMSKAASITKRLKFIFPFYHAWNFWRNSVLVNGLQGSVPLFFDGAKTLENPENTSRILQMGVNLFRANKFSGDITDEIQGLQGKNIFSKVSNKIGDALFVGMGDSLTAGIVNIMEKRMAGKGFTTQEANEIISEVTNNLSGNLSPSSMGRGMRDIGRIGLLARNWTLSNIRIGFGALGGEPKGWNKKQKEYTANLYRGMLVAGFAHLFAVSQALNYTSTKRAYGKGRFTWENQGKWQNKIMPVLYIDKKNGIEYYGTNWYGAIGDIIHWSTDPLKTAWSKTAIPIQESVAQLTNLDLHSGDKIVRDSDNLVQAMAHRLEHVTTGVSPAGISVDKGVETAVPPATMRLLGLAVSRANRYQDSLDTIYTFKDKQNYAVKDLHEKVLKLLGKGDTKGAMDVIMKDPDINDPEMLTSTFEYLLSPSYHAFESLSADDQTKLLISMSPDKRKKFISDLGKSMAKRE